MTPPQKKNSSGLAPRMMPGPGESKPDQGRTLLVLRCLPSSSPPSLCLDQQRLHEIPEGFSAEPLCGRGEVGERLRAALPRCLPSADLRPPAERGSYIRAPLTAAVFLPVPEPWPILELINPPSSLPGSSCSTPKRGKGRGGVG